MVRERPTRLRHGAAAALLGAVLVLAGCGADDPGPSAAVTTSTRTQQAPRTTVPRAAVPGPTPEALREERRLFPDLPTLQAVPQTATGPADAADRRIAERWFDAVRRDRPADAAALMADGARFANIDVLQVRNRAAREAVVESLPCGARPVSVGGADDGYVVLTLVLTDKVGEAPCDGAGGRVAVSLHVTDGRIDDWVRVQAEDAPINRGSPV